PASNSNSVRGARPESDGRCGRLWRRKFALGGVAYCTGGCHPRMRARAEESAGSIATARIKDCVGRKRKSMAFKYPGANIRGLSPRLMVWVAAALVVPLVPAAVRAKEPARTVKLIVNFPAGAGTADAIARITSEWLARKWLRPVVVENIPG